MTNRLSLLSLILEGCVMWPSLSQMTRVKHHFSDSKRTQAIYTMVFISKQTMHDWAVFIVYVMNLILERRFVFGLMLLGHRTTKTGVNN